MTHDRDIERLLDAWFTDGPMQVADHVLDDAAGRVHRQRQRPAWRFLWREPHVITPFKIALSTAFATVLVITGLALFRASPSPVGGIGSGAPYPSPTLSPSPSTMGLLRDGRLDPGRYVTRPFGGANSSITLTFQVPEGWSGFPDWALLGPKGTRAPDGILIGFLAPDRVLDPCHWDLAGSGVWPQRGDFLIGAGEPPDTPARDLASSLAYVYLERSSPTDVRLGGYAGRKMDIIRLGKDLDLATCDKASGADEGSYFVFGSSDPIGSGLYAQGPDSTWHVWLLDVGETPIAVIIADYPGTPQLDRDAAQSIVDSLVISRP